MVPIILAMTLALTPDTDNYKYWEDLDSLDRQEAISLAPESIQEFLINPSIISHEHQHEDYDLLETDDCCGDSPYDELLPMLLDIEDLSIRGILSNNTLLRALCFEVLNKFYMECSVAVNIRFEFISFFIDFTHFNSDYVINYLLINEDLMNHYSNLIGSWAGVQLSKSWNRRLLDHRPTPLPSYNMDDLNSILFSLFDNCTFDYNIIKVFVDKIVYYAKQHCQYII